MPQLEAIAVIPASGLGRRIPRQHARLIAGKPVLAYSIEAARQAVGAVYVTTEDDELAEIAARFGANVIRREAALADPGVALDTVVLDAVRRIEAQGVGMDFVATVQPTSPLLESATIAKAVAQCRGQGLDTVLSVVNDPRLSWGETAGGAIEPLYEKRVKRDALPPHYRETGGVCVCARALLDQGTRFGKRVGVVEVSKEEAIYIDSYFEWWLAEKSLTRRRICFHVVGNRACGLGHVYRALTLADRLIDHDVCFLVNTDSALGAEVIRGREYPVFETEPGGEAAWLAEHRPDLAVNDVLDTTAEYMNALKAAGVRTVNFEDLGPGALCADYVINAMYEPAQWNGTNPQRALPARHKHGAQYCCLRDEFYTAPPIAEGGPVENVLVMFGGTDPSGMTLRALTWLDALDGPWRITCIVGLGHPDPDAVEAFARQARHAVEVVRDTRVVSRYMASAQAAVTSAGRTVFELGSLGVPAIVVAQNERELHHLFSQTNAGVVFLGPASGLDEARFAAAARQVLESELLRVKMRQCLLDAKLRHGVDQVVAIIETVLHEEPAGKELA